MKRKRNMNPKPYSLFIFLGGLALLMGFALYFSGQEQQPVLNLQFSEFVSKVENGEIKTATIDDQIVSGSLKSGAAYEAVIMPSEKLSWMMQRQGVIIQVKQQERQQWSPVTILFAAFIIGLLIMMVYLRGAGGGMGGGSSSKLFNIGRSKARMFEPNTVKTTFKDVAGLVEAKEELRDIVDFLRSPEKFKAIGAKIPRGVLLNGNPGNGKTLLAKAVAGEANCTFLSINGSDFVEVFVGVGASRVRDLFAQARKHAPCIIFIDEIDAVGRQRGSNAGGNNDEREQTLNQLLAEMDGFSTEAGSVIVLAATNRVDVLDKALTRPGRFDRVVVVPYPDVRARQQILEVHAKKVQMEAEVDLAKIARGTARMSGADLENLINEAALSATKQGKKAIAMNDFELARDKILVGGERKSAVTSDAAKLKVAYHEAGHALANMLTPAGAPLHKITILPRGDALGLTWYFPSENAEIGMHSAAEFRAMMMSAFGGMIAEKIKYGESETGVSSDIQKATDIARKMVTLYGMSSLGPIAFASAKEDRLSKLSESTNAKIDAEVEKIMAESYKASDELLRANIDKLDVFAKALVEAETMDASEVYALLGIPPRESFSFSPSKENEAGNIPLEEKV